MARPPQSEASTGASRQSLVQSAAAGLRDLIFAREADERIGSLPELAQELGVGIVTVQQAARVLEHEGLLEVRRGPGGGYYGRRPDAAVLERSLAAYMRTQPASWDEALDMTSLLFNELVAAAAGCGDRERQDELRAFAQKVAQCDSDQRLAEMEQDFQDLLFAMVNRPLFELLTRVTLRFAESRPQSELYSGAIPLDQWKVGRRRIIDAILRQDEELARFEADRNNRRAVLDWLHRHRAAQP